MINLTPSGTEEQKKRPREISGDSLNERRAAKVCLRYGVKGHSQWYCPESQLKATVTSAQFT
jgi:hypothetical protein